MPLPLQSFSEIVQKQAAAIQSVSTQLTDFTEGSVLRAIVESNAGNSIWIQSLISALLAVARLQTSSGNDVDTFIQQFGYSRELAVAATGNVTFSRTITTSLSYIPASTTRVQTSLNQTIFQTYIVTSHPNYDPATNSYVMGLGISSITVPVKCVVAGSVGNVEVGAIDTINSVLTNVNNVTNAAAFTNGSDQADDPTAKADFVLYLQGLSKGTKAAIASAVVSVPGVTRYKIVENENESAQVQLGYFFVVIDNGLGTISDQIRDQVVAAVELVRGLSIQFNIDKATPASPGISAIAASLTVDTADSATRAAITAAIKANLVSFIGSLPINGTLYYTRLAQIIYDSSDHIIDATSILLNGSTSDVSAGALEILTLDPNDVSINYL